MEDNVGLIESHHALGMDVLSPCINSREDDVYESVEYAFEDVVPPTSIPKEFFVDDIPPQEIIVEIFHLR